MSLLTRINIVAITRLLVALAMGMAILLVVSGFVIYSAVENGENSWREFDSGPKPKIGY